MSHSHGGQPCTGHGPAPQQQQVMLPQQPDPVALAAIEANFKPVDFLLDPSNDARVLCKPHKLDKCSDCGHDFTFVNALAGIFTANPSLMCPPPPQVVQPQRSQAVMKAKEEGNVLFKAQKHQQAISMYNMAAAVASQRLPWEPNSLMREELSTVLSNRSAAYAAAGDHVGSLVDADVVIQLKRQWSKGHFRKAKALMELGYLEEAKEAIQLGLSFEPTNTEMTTFLADVEAKLSAAKKS